MNEITMQQNLLQHCIIVSCSNYQCSRIPFLDIPRRRQPGTNSLIEVVCSSMIWLQHKASCYRGHGYSNRLIFPTGVHWCHTTRSDPRVSYTLFRHVRPRGVRYAEVHPSSSTESPSAGLNPKYAGPWTPTPTYSCMVHGWPVKHSK